MKSLILTLSFLMNSPVDAKVLKQENVIYIDPAADGPVPVYLVGADGKPTGKVMYNLIPGEMASVTEVTNDGWVVRATKENGETVRMMIKKEDHGTETSPKAQVAIRRARQINVGAEPTRASIYDGNDPATKEFCSQNPDKCEAALDAGREVQIKSSSLKLVVDERSGKEIWRNYYQIDHSEADKTEESLGEDLWIDSNDTTGVGKSWAISDVEEPKKAKEEPCENPVIPPKTLNAFTDIELAAKKQQVKFATTGADVSQEQIDAQFKDILPLVGDCYPTSTSGDYHAQLVGNIEQKFKDGKMKPMFKQRLNKDGKIEAINAFPSDLVAVDLLARTLYGEAASCFDDGIQAPEAVAKTVLNRVDAYKKYGKSIGRFNTPDAKTDFRNDVTNVIFKDKQFSIWNRNEKARHMVMCPPASDNPAHWRGKGGPSKKERQIWEAAVKIAMDAVFSGETFRQHASDMKSLYYTTDFQMDPRHFKAMKSVTLSGKRVPVTHCLQFWTEKQLTERFGDEFGFYHPFFLRALGTFSQAR